MRSNRHPNAVASFASAGGGGAALVYLLALAGVDLPAPLVPVVAGALSALVLFLGRNGLRGLVRVVWRGT